MAVRFSDGHNWEVSSFQQWVEEKQNFVTHRQIITLKSLKSKFFALPH